MERTITMDNHEKLNGRYVLPEGILIVKHYQDGFDWNADYFCPVCGSAMVGDGDEKGCTMWCEKDFCHNKNKYYWEH